MNHLLRNLPRYVKQIIAFGFDVGAAWLTLWLAYSLRYETLFWPRALQWWPFVIAPLLATPIFIRFGLYRAVIRYTGLSALQAIAKAVFIYGFIFCMLLFSIRWEGVPRTVGVLQPILYLLVIAISRALVRFWLNTESRNSNATASERLLIYGAGAAGIQIAHALIHAKDYRIVGFMDDDVSLQGKTINDWHIYKPSELDSVMARDGVNGVLLALPSISKSRRFDILESLRDKALHVRSLPSLSDIASGSVSLSDIHELDVDDLLGRAAIAPDPALMAKNISGKVVLVTGAGGSIGGELCKQILNQAPATLLLLDHSEYSLYAIHQALLARQMASDSLKGQQQTQIVPLLATVRDPVRLALIFQAWKPHTVYHAAAYKHVPMVEHNVSEGLATNVLGTLYTAQAAAQSGAAYFVLISTDKAVRPTNVMGATKRAAELVLQALAKQEKEKISTATIFTMVRFGNVLDSSGSVVPLFRQQIKNGGPITLTHPDVTRYFMTIPEAAQLVIQAAAMATGGEVFVLDMGEPVKIADLAKRMVELSGLSVRDTQHPQGDIEIKITGLRPGEKLYEELLIGNNPKASQHARIMQAAEDYFNWDILKAHLDLLRENAILNQTEEIKSHLAQLVSGYNSESPNVDWLTRINNRGISYANL